MKDKNINNSRRQVLKGAISSLAVVSAGSMLPLLNANAAHHEMAKLDENDPAAKALGYKHDATQVDVVAYPKRAGEAGASQFCDNCSLYTGDAGADWGGCRIFPDKLVKAKGWCNAWVRK